MLARRFRFYDARVEHSLENLVEDRLASLERDGFDVVACAALLGYRFEVSLLAGCACLRTSRVRAALLGLCERDLIVRESGSPERYRFRHALIQAAIRESLPVVSRTLRHARIAAFLETLPDAERRVEQLAYHWSAAGVRGKAAHYCERAAQDAIRLGSPSDAAAWRARVS